jgi:hypothetical protein
MRSKFYAICRLLFGVALSLLAMLAAPADAHAGKGPPKAIVVYAEGPDSKDVRLDAVKVIPAEFSVGNTDAFVKALGKQGHKGPMAKPFDKPKDREKLVGQLRKAAGAEGLEAVIIMLTSKDKKGNRAVRIILVETKSTAPFFDKEIPLEKKKKGGDDQEALRDALKSPLDNLLPPPEPEKKEEEEKKPKKEGEEEEKDKEKEKKAETAKEGERPVNELSRALVVINAGLEFGIRRFDYTNRKSLDTKDLRSYDVPGAPMFVIGAELYPGAGASPLIPGLLAGYSRAFALKSAPQGGDPIDTSWYRFHVGLRERINVAGDKGPIIGLSVLYGGETFGFTANTALAQQVPAVAYKFVRLALDGRIPIGPGAVFLGLGYELVSSGPKCSAACNPAPTDNLADRFTDAKVSGFDLHIGGAYTFTPGLEARLTIIYRHFGYTINSGPSDRFSADGAGDNLSGVQLGIAYAY